MSAVALELDTLYQRKVQADFEQKRQGTLYGHVLNMNVHATKEELLRYRGFDFGLLNAAASDIRDSAKSLFKVLPPESPTAAYVNIGDGKYLTVCDVGISENAKQQDVCIGIYDTKENVIKTDISLKDMIDIYNGHKFEKLNERLEYRRDIYMQHEFSAKAEDFSKLNKVWMDSFASLEAKTNKPEPTRISPVRNRNVRTPSPSKDVILFSKETLYQHQIDAWKRQGNQLLAQELPANKKDAVLETLNTKSLPHITVSKMNRDFIVYRDCDEERLTAILEGANKDLQECSVGKGTFNSMSAQSKEMDDFDMDR